MFGAAFRSLELICGSGCAIAVPPAALQLRTHGWLSPGARLLHARSPSTRLLPLLTRLESRSLRVSRSLTVVAVLRCPCAHSHRSLRQRTCRPNARSSSRSHSRSVFVCFCSFSRRGVPVVCVHGAGACVPLSSPTASCTRRCVAVASRACFRNRCRSCGMSQRAPHHRAVVCCRCSLVRSA